MDREQRKAAPNYTVPALVMGWINLMWIFIGLWAIWGWLVVIPVAVAANWAIDRLEDRLREN